MVAECLKYDASKDLNAATNSIGYFTVAVYVHHRCPNAQNLISTFTNNHMLDLAIRCKHHV